jgi:hypothetical protein
LDLLVPARTALHLVPAEPAFEDVFAHLAVEGVVAFTALEGVVAVAAADHIVSGEAGELVVSAQAGDHVGSHGPGDLIGLIGPGDVAGQLQRALSKRDVMAVRSLAGELPTVPLPLAAEITLLLLEREPESYVPAARRLLARVASERAMSLRQLTDVAALLAELEADPAPTNAGKTLVRLVDSRVS